MKYYDCSIGFYAVVLLTGSCALAANSATVVTGSLTQGSVKSSLGAGTSYAKETNHLNDWVFNTGGFGGKVTAISATNANFNGNEHGGTPDTMIAFGDGGGVTLRFDQPIKPVAGEKEFGLFTAQMVLPSTGGIFNGNMEAAILISADNVNWRTLAGVVVGDPLTYIATSHKFNAPTMAYDYGTTATAWTYGSPGATAAELSALTVADYQTPMPDDNLFNGTGGNGDRLALAGDTLAATYDTIFGASGGGNWFDLSDSGLAEVGYLRLNGVNSGGAAGGIRLDAVYTTAVAVVPEPAALVVLPALIALLGRRRRGASN